MSITKPATYANSQVQIGDGASPEVFTDIKFIVKDSIKFAGESRKAIDGTRYNSPDGIVEKFGNPLLDPGDFEFSMYLAPDDPGQANPLPWASQSLCWGRAHLLPPQGCRGMTISISRILIARIRP